MFKTKVTLGVTIVFFICISGVTTAVRRQGPDLSTLLTQMQSNDWQQRAAALDQLVAIPNVLNSQQVRDALVDLLDRENQLISTTLVESNGQSGTSDKYGEGYSEYYSELLGVVKDVADISNDRRALDVLTHGAYNPESPLAQYLISKGEIICDGTQPPTLIAPSDVSVSTKAGATACGVVINDATLGSPTVSDNCLGARVNRSGVPANNFFPVGKTTITYIATNALGREATVTRIITIIDGTPPSIANVSVSPSSIWPPNHKMVSVTVNYTTSDNCAPASGLTNKLSVSSNEGTTADWQIVDAHHVLLRADKGNVYTITIASTDSKGNKSSKSVIVSVPHDQGK